MWKKFSIPRLRTCGLKGKYVSQGPLIVKGANGIGIKFCMAVSLRQISFIIRALKDLTS